jgi:hypothetical protein
MREQESAERAVEAGWKRDQNSCAWRSGAGLFYSLPGSGGRGAGELAYVTATPITTRRIIARFTHPLLNPASFAQTRPRSRSGGVAGQRSFSQPNRGL